MVGSTLASSSEKKFMIISRSSCMCSLMVSASAQGRLYGAWSFDTIGGNGSVTCSFGLYWLFPLVSGMTISTVRVRGLFRSSPQKLPNRQGAVQTIHNLWFLEVVTLCPVKDPIPEKEKEILFCLS